MGINLLTKKNNSKHCKNIFVLMACALFALNSCNSTEKEEEITKEEAIAMAKNIDLFENSKYNFVKITKVWSKNEATDGLAKYVKNEIDNILHIEVGYTETYKVLASNLLSTWDYNDYTFSKQRINTLGDGYSFYKKGKKPLMKHIYYYQIDNYKNKGLDFEEKITETLSYDENCYLIKLDYLNERTCKDGSIFTFLTEESYQWIE